MKTEEERRNFLILHVPTWFHDYVEDLSRYWLAALIFGIRDREERKRVLASISNEGIRSWVRSKVECLWKGA